MSSSVPKKMAEGTDLIDSTSAVTRPAKKGGISTMWPCRKDVERTGVITDSDVDAGGRIVLREEERLGVMSADSAK